MSKIFNRPVVFAGEIRKVGTYQVNVKELDSNGMVTRATGTTVPADGDAGFAIGCKFVKTNGTIQTIEYVNEGTTTSADFNAVQSGVVVQATSATIATTSNTDAYVIAPFAGVLRSVDFSGVDALAAHDSNYITFSLTNLGQAGGGSTAMLAATDANTTKVTGGTALSANTKRSLTLHGTAANLVVAAGDRIRIRAAATGTLANTVTFPTYLVRFTAS